MALFHDAEQITRRAFGNEIEANNMPRINIAESNVLQQLRANPDFRDKDNITIWPTVRGYSNGRYFSNHAVYLNSTEFRPSWLSTQEWHQLSDYWEMFEYAHHDSGHTDYAHDKCISRAQWNLHYDPESPKYLFSKERRTVKYYIYPESADNAPPEVTNQRNFIEALNHKFHLDAQRAKEQENLFHPNNMNIIHHGRYYSDGFCDINNMMPKELFILMVK